MKNDNLVETIRTILEQKSEPFKGGGSDTHGNDPTGPNKVVDEDVEEVDEAASAGSKKRYRVSSLGRLEKRRPAGNQSRRPGSYLGEVRKIAMEKVKDKKTGQTDTKQQPESVDVNPEMKPMNGNY